MKRTITVFRLGSLEHKLIPSHETVEKLEAMLKEWDGKSDLFLVWGPDLEIVTTEVELPDGAQPTILIAPPEAQK